MLLTGNASDFLEIGVASAGRGDLEAIRTLLKEKPAWLNMVGSHGRTMLWEAVYRGKMDVLKFLVEKGADVNACGCHYSEHYVEVSPYCIAKLKKRKKIAEYLIGKGAIIDIHSASYLGDVETISSLLENDLELVNQGHPQSEMVKSGFEYQDAFWATPRHYSIGGGQKEASKLLISCGAEIFPHSKRLLSYAMGRERADLVRLLLENGANYEEAPQVYRDEGEIFLLLKAYGVEPADPNAPDKWPDIVYLSRGDKGEHPEQIQRLLELEADVNIRNYKEKTALHYAAKAGFTKVMNLLLENGADVDASDREGETPLFDAINSTIKNKSKKKNAIAVLLSHGADPNFKSHEGLTPMQLVQQSRSKEKAEIVKMFQDVGKE